MPSQPLPFHLLNAFIVDSNPRSGNQAAVVLFKESTDVRSNDQEWLDLLAKDFDYSMTAFLTPLTLDEGGKIGEWDIRWFTTEGEAEICGHATLASCSVLFSSNPGLETIKLHTKYKGILEANKIGHEGEIQISLPSLEEKVLNTLATTRGNEDDIQNLSKIFNIDNNDILSLSETRINGMTNWIIQLDERLNVGEIKVDVSALAKIIDSAIITQVDSSKSIESKQLYINSRFFAPKLGINEDTATGSVHANLTGYYLISPAQKYIPKELIEIVNGNIKELTIIGNQRSKRGGQLICNWVGYDKVNIKGKAFEFGRGFVNV